MELQWYIVFGVIGLISCWALRYWGLPIFVYCCNGCIKKVLSDELEKMEIEEEKIIEKLINPKVLVDEETGELYFDGQLSPSKRRQLEDNDDDSSTDDNEKNSEDDIENSRKSSFQSDRKLSMSMQSDRKLSFQLNDNPSIKSKKKFGCRNPFKLAKIAQAKAEREAFQAAIIASIRTPTKEEKIQTGINNFKSNFIYKVESDVGWYLTRDQVLCMTPETRANLYKMPTSAFFHKVSRKNKKKPKHDYQPEWDAATSIDGMSWKLKRKHSKLWRLKTVIGMMDDPPSICRMNERRKNKEEKKIGGGIFDFNDPNIAEKLLNINRKQQRSVAKSDDLARSESGASDHYV